MAEETFLRLQHSEGKVCDMASRLLAAFIASGQCTQENEDQLIGRSAFLAVKLADKVDKIIESDDEKGEHPGM
jgi:hypothetical protein